VGRYRALNPLNRDLSNRRCVRLPAVCILAGGLGTRLGELTKQIPKGLVIVAGAPFLDHQLRILARYGVERVVMCVGYRGELIESEIGHKRWGIDLRYSYDSPQLDGTLGAIRRALPMLGDHFLVLYGDTFLRIDYLDFASAWIASGLPGAMAILRNDDRWDQSNAVFKDGRVTHYDKRRHLPSMKWIDYGLGGLVRSAVELFDNTASDLSALYSTLASELKLFGYEATERFYEIGRPENLDETDRFIRSYWSLSGG
jgi:NDP-sugar pyrophosphorylase family protein